MLGSNASIIYGISNFTINTSAITYKIDKYTSGRDNLVVKIGNTTVATRNNITGDATNSYTKTIIFTTAELTNIYNLMPKVTKATFTFTVTTYIDGVSIGSSTATATGTLANTLIPNLSNISLVDSVSAIATKFDAFIKNKSRVYYDYTVIPAVGTTITSYNLTIDGSTYTNARGTTNVLKNSGTLNYSAYVVDSRGRKSNTITGTISVLDYTPPQITTFKVVRCEADGTESITGLYAKYTIDASITSLNEKNDKSFNILYREQGTEDWHVWRMISNIYSLKETSSVVKISEEGWQFRVMMFDYFNLEENPISKIYDLSSTFLLFELTENLDGIAFGKTADESDAFDIGFGKTYLSNDTYIGGDKKNNDEKNIHFQTAEDAEQYSDVKIYGGRGTSATGLGIWDVGNDRQVFSYFPEVSRFMFGPDIILDKNGKALINEIIKNAGHNTGTYHLSNGLLIQHGVVSVTPTAVNTATSVTVIFPVAYTYRPTCFGIVQTSSPQSQTISIGQGSASLDNFSIYITRTAVSSTNIHWFAVGYKEVQ